MNKRSQQVMKQRAKLKRVELLLRPEDYEAVKQRAKSEGMSISAYIKKLCHIGDCTFWYCYHYIGTTCVNGNCPNAQEDSFHEIKCSDCWYYKGYDDCAAPYYHCCPNKEVNDND